VQDARLQRLKQGYPRRVSGARILVLPTILAAAACATSPPPAAAPPDVAREPKGAEPPEVANERGAAEAAVARSLPALRACYGRDLAADPDLERDVLMTVFVGGDGAVVAEHFGAGIVRQPAGVAGPEKPVLDLRVSQCLAHELGTWRLPPTRWSGELQVHERPAIVVRVNPTPAERGPSPEVRAVISPIITRQLEPIKTCASEFSKRRPHGPRVTVRVHVVVEDRRVRAVTVDDAGGADAPLAQCVVATMTKLDFSDAPPEKLDFHYPLTFLGD
jgi:hypothetical protein